jgi:cell division protein FtsZ
VAQPTFGTPTPVAQQPQNFVPQPVETPQAPAFSAQPQTIRTESVPVFQAESQTPAAAANPVFTTAPEPQTSATQSEPSELVPVPASVFDDDFFLRPRRADGTYVVEETTIRVEETTLRTDVRVPSFGGLAPAEPQEEHDELDIPAFLRRGSM